MHDGSWIAKDDLERVRGAVLEPLDGRLPQLRQLSQGALRCDGNPPVHHMPGH